MTRNSYRIASIFVLQTRSERHLTRSFLACSHQRNDVHTDTSHHVVWQCALCCPSPKPPPVNKHSLAKQEPSGTAHSCHFGHSLSIAKIIVATVRCARSLTMLLMIAETMEERLDVHCARPVLASFGNIFTESISLFFSGRSLVSTVNCFNVLHTSTAGTMHETNHSAPWGPFPNKASPAQTVNCNSDAATLTKA